MRQIVKDTQYRGVRGIAYAYEIAEDDGRVYVTLVVTRPETFTGTVSAGRGWRHELHPSMSESQIVKMLFGMGQDFDEHEAREGFVYKGRRVFGPHIDIAAMWSVATTYEQRKQGASDWAEVDGPPMPQCEAKVN